MGSQSISATTSLYFPSDEVRLGKLENNPTLGYFIVASRDVEAGELMCEGTPLMVCPCTGVSDFGYICLTCFKPCTTACNSCGWPICCIICEKGKLHSTYECGILARNEVTLKNPTLDYAAIKIMRCLLMRDKEPFKWELLIQHDAQLENRASDPRTATAREHVTHFILEKCQLANSFDAGTIETVMGIMATNEFTLQLHDYHRNVYLIMHRPSYFAHSCTPNATIVWKFNPASDCSYSENYFSVKFFAARDISAGEVLTHTYIGETFSVISRQRFLYDHYYFRCDCERCRVELFNEILSADFEVDRTETSDVSP